MPMELSSITKKMQRAELYLASAVDDLSMILEASGGRIPASGNVADIWQSVPAPARSLIEQSIRGLSQVEVIWNARQTFARIRFDSDRPFELPRKLAELLVALAQGRLQMQPDGLSAWRGHNHLAAELGIKSHALTQLLSRLRKQIPNPLLVQTEVSRGSSPLYRLAMRAGGELRVVQEFQRVQDRNGSGLGAAADSDGPVITPPRSHLLGEVAS